MKKILFFAQRLFVAYWVALLAIIFSLFHGISYSSIVETDLIIIVVMACLSCLMLMMFADRRVAIKNVNYYSKTASLNYGFSVVLVVYTLFMKGSNIYLVLAPALILSLFNIYLCFMIQAKLSNYIVIPELQLLNKLMPNVKQLNIDYDYTFLKYHDKPNHEPRKYKIITALGHLSFDGHFFYLNDKIYSISNFMDGFKSCEIDIETATADDAKILQMFCI